MMARNLKSPARHQPDHFEVAMISDANDLFRVTVDLDDGHVGFLLLGFLPDFGPLHGKWRGSARRC